eukprot:scpid12476/ scgid4301/ Transmembrane protein 17
MEMRSFTSTNRLPSRALFAVTTAGASTSANAVSVDDPDTAGYRHGHRQSPAANQPVWAAQRPLRDPTTILDPWRSTLISIMEVAFPQARQLQLFERPMGRRRKPQLGDSEIHSDVPLSMLLYFSSVYLVFWIPLVIAALIMKYGMLTGTFQAINLVLYVALLIVEVFRLLLGYYGNLAEEVPELSLCWVLTLLWQAPLALFLAFNEVSNMHTLPEERGANVPLAILLLIEVVIMRRAVNKLIRSKIAKMRLNGFDDLSDTQPTSASSTSLPMTGHRGDVRSRSVVLGNSGLMTTPPRSTATATTAYQETSLMTNALNMGTGRARRTAAAMPAGERPPAHLHANATAASLPGGIGD